MAHVLILGGGFGGLAAADQLRRTLAAGDEITVVDRGDRFFMGFAKLWDLAGTRPLEEGTAPLDRLGRRGIRFVQADIQRLDPESLTVETSAGALRGDAILVALGAGAAPPHREMLRAGRAHDLYDAGDLPAMRAVLDSVDSGRVLVAILGVPLKCPPAPYEAAFIVDERLRRRGVRDAVEVAVASPQPATLPVAGPDASRYLAERLAERGIRFLPEHRVTGIDPDRRRVQFADGSEEACDVIFGVPACAPPPVLAGGPLAGGSGWIEPDPRTLATRFERVYAVGDCTAVPTATGQLPKAGVFAAAEGRVAAANIAADLSGTGERASFDGYGFCFLELPGNQVAFVEGNFLADPPDVHITPPDADRYRQKQQFERERLAAWLGAG